MFSKHKQPHKNHAYINVIYYFKSYFVHFTWYFWTLTTTYNTHISIEKGL